MLGRTANGLFWMFRYLERAENTARLLDAGMRMALTRDLVTAEEEWRSVMATAGQKQGYEAKHGTYTGMQAWNYMLRDKENPASIIWPSAYCAGAKFWAAERLYHSRAVGS